MADFAILVIDDDAALLDLVAELLEQAHYTVLTASSGSKGLLLVRTVRPHLILLDAEMPGLDGVDVLRQLKRDPATRHIPVVAITGTAGDRVAEMMREGCVGYIPKPIAPREFIRLVGDFLRVTAGQRPDLWARPPGPAPESSP